MINKIKELQRGTDEFAIFALDYDEPLLDYVAILAEKYKPYNELAHERGFIVSSAIEDFIMRYFEKEVDNKNFKKHLKKYLEDKGIQNTIKAFGYDVEKLWYLLLFINDFSEGYFLEGVNLNDSPMEQINKLLRGIAENLNPVKNDNQEISFKKQTQIVLEGVKPKIIVDNPKALYWLIFACLHEIKKVDKNSELERSHTPLKIKNGKLVNDSILNTQRIWYFAKMFLTFFELKPPQSEKDLTSVDIISTNKMLFISKLAYLMELSFDESLSKSDDKLKDYRRQYKNKDLDLGRVNVRYSQ